MKKPDDVNSVKLIRADTTTGFKNNQAWFACTTKEGLVWISTLGGNIYQADDSKKIILPFTNLNNSIGGNNFYEENDSTIWIETAGLIKKNTRTGKEKIHRHNDHNTNCLATDNVSCILKDNNGTLWLGTNDGLDSNNQVLCIAEDSSDIWVATANGLDRMIKSNGTIQHFLKASFVKAVFMDATGILWAGATDGVYYFDAHANDVIPFNNINVTIGGAIGINGDSHNNLWIAGANEIFKIDSTRENVAVYTTANGVHANTFLFCSNITTREDELLMGDQVGYYHFFPKDVEFTPAARPTCTLPLSGSEIKK